MHANCNVQPLQMGLKATLRWWIDIDEADDSDSKDAQCIDCDPCKW